MKTVSLSGSLRKNVGKKDAIRLRSEGQVPCVLYGGDEQIHVHVREADLKKLIYTPNVYQIDLDLEGKAYKVVIQDAQFHPVTDEILHIDFLQLFEGKPVKIKLPVRLVGDSIGVRNGGRLAQLYRKLTVKALPKDFPEEIEIDIENLKFGQSIRVEDLSFAGLEFLDAKSAVICGVRQMRGMIEEELEEEELEEGEEGVEGEEGAEGGEEGAKEEAAAEEKSE